MSADIDIDVPDRSKLLELIQHVPARQEVEGKPRRHNSGIYVTEIPRDVVNGCAAIDYEEAEQRGYFKIDFLPNFPDINTIAADKVKLIKIAKELYKAKGIPDSFKFLFRALYDCYADITPTRDFIFKASDGKWVVPKSIKIKSTDPNFLKINNLKVFSF